MRRFPCDVGAATPHGDADVRALQCGRIIHPVASHCHKFAPRLECFDDPEFVFGGNPRKHPDVAHALRELRIGERGDVVAGYHHVVYVRHAQSYRDSQRGCGMVAGNHHHVNACRLTRFHGSRYLSPRRIDQSNKSKQRQLGLDTVERPRCHGTDTGGHRQHA